MIKTYRYTWTRVTQNDLDKFAGPGMIVVPISEFILDIEAEETQKEDLDAYMNSIHFKYVGEINI